MPPKVASIFASLTSGNRRVSATWVLSMATWVHQAPTCHRVVVQRSEAIRRAFDCAHTEWLCPRFFRSSVKRSSPTGRLTPPSSLRAQRGAGGRASDHARPSAVSPETRSSQSPQRTPSAATRQPTSAEARSASSLDGQNRTPCESMRGSCVQEATALRSSPAHNPLGQVQHIVQNERLGRLRQRRRPCDFGYVSSCSACSPFPSSGSSRRPLSGRVSGERTALACPRPTGHRPRLVPRPTACGAWRLHPATLRPAIWGDHLFVRP